MSPKEKERLRKELNQRYLQQWQSETEAMRPPVFPGCNQAAERLRRLPAIISARTLAIMPDPVLLQARINALNLGKELLCPTPGFKQGLVRLTPSEVPFAERSRGLTGHTLIKTGHQLRLPQARLGRVDLLIGAALAVDAKGNLLGDGRGLLDLCWHLLRLTGTITQKTPLAVLVAEEQLMEELPSDDWDVGADVVITPKRVIYTQGKRPEPGLDWLPEKLANLPIVKALK